MEPITVVLGAGASRGASFTKERACKPPLNKDFFTQLQRVSKKKHKAIVEQIIKDTTDLFAFNFKLTLEEFFTQIEYFRKFIDLTEPRREFNLDRLNKIRSNFLQGLAALFEESIAEPGSYESRICKYHNKIVDVLRPRDTIISFNYDCLIDDTLKRRGKNKWHPRYGYCIPLRTSKGHKKYHLKGLKRWTPKNTVTVHRENTITLLKLHGSLHWYIDEAKHVITFKERPYTKQRGKRHFTIIPPEWNKEYYEDIELFTHLWAEADRRLRRTRHLILIGYSLTDTDLHSLALFRIAIPEKKLKTLIIVNPDQHVRFKTRQVLLHGITDKTKIIVFDTFEEFSRVNLTDKKSPCT